MNKPLIFGAVIALGAAFILIPMDYTKFPSINSQVPNGPAQPVTSSVQPKNFTGSGSFPGQSGFNLGGPTGVNLSGTQGFWAGAKDFANAPTSIDRAGNALFRSISIKDSNGTAVLDSFGIVSTTQFSSNVVEVTPSPTATQTTDFSAAVPGLTVSIPLKRSAFVFIFANSNGGSAAGFTTDDKCIFSMAIDGATVGPQVRVAGHIYFTGSPFTYANTGFDYDEPAALSTIVMLDAGTHTLDLRFATTNPVLGFQAQVGAFKNDIGYIVLGT